MILVAAYARKKTWAASFGIGGLHVWELPIPPLELPRSGLRGRSSKLEPLA